MPEIYKTLYTPKDLDSDANYPPFNPSVVDDLVIFRLSRLPWVEPTPPPVIYKTNKDLTEFSKFSDLPSPPVNWEEWGDARLFKYKNKYYVNLNKINWNHLNSPKIKQKTPPNSKGQSNYTSLVSVLDIEKDFKETEICPLQWKINRHYANPFQEKNYAFFEFDENLYFMRGISEGVQYVYKLNLETGQADLVYMPKYEIKYPEVKYGWIKICSTPFYYDNFFWAACHSHPTHINPNIPHSRTFFPNYYAGICCFEAKPPFKIVKISQKPIFDFSIYYKNVSKNDFLNAKKSILTWPSSLVIKNGNFQLGVTTQSQEHQDFINLSYEEILKHLDEGESFIYPSNMFKGTSAADLYIAHDKDKFDFNMGYSWLDDMSMPLELS